MILITGATGQVGGEVLDALVAAGTAVRAFVRNASAIGAHRGVQVVQGNFDDDASLSHAFEGVEAIRASQELDATVPIVLLSPQGRTLTHSVAQELAGHRNIATTMRYYAQVNTQDLRDGVEKVRAAG